MSTPLRLESPHANPILLAEDHDICRRITVAQLDQFGVLTIAVSDGKMAFQAWLTHRPSVVISDYRLPGLNGHELAHRIRAHEQADFPRTTMILLSVTMTAKDIEAGLYAGFDECLMKPLLGNPLAQALTRWGIPHEAPK